MRFRSAAVVMAILALGVVTVGCGRAQAPAEPAEPTAPGAGSGAKAPAADAPASGQAAAAGGQRYVIDGARSTASYSVQEKFANRDLPNLAVGTTSTIAGELVLVEGGIGPSVVTVDLRTLQSDSSRRDGRLRQQYLESDKYPMAEFKIAGASGDAPAFAEGQETHFRLTGTMNLHGVEREVTWDARGTRQGDTLVWNATMEFKLTDFGIEVPDIIGMLKVDDWAKLDVSLTATLAGS